MDTSEDRDAQERLASYITDIGNLLGNPSQRAAFAMYAYGLFGPAARKTMEAIAAQACPDEARTGAAHQRIQHFISNADWSDSELRLAASRHVLAEMTRHSEIETWIVDDTGFEKQGKHSVGVQRQYTGSAGKITNCQIGTSLTLATANFHVPVDFELYIPETWTDDANRRKRAKIPPEVKFQTKPQQALTMIRRALEGELPKGTVLADEAYGDSAAFRMGLRIHGLHYGVAVSKTTKVHPVDKNGKVSEEAFSVSKLINRDRRRYQFHRYTWREGTNRALSARFAFRRIVPANERHRGQREHLWLITEWRDGEPRPAHFYLVTEQNLSRKEMARQVKERWRTERVYQDFKNQLGLDHFEGRSYGGWHHHVTVGLVCYAFLVAELARCFPPSAEWTPHHGPLRLAA